MNKLIDFTYHSEDQKDLIQTNYSHIIRLSSEQKQKQKFGEGCVCGEIDQLEKPWTTLYTVTNTTTIPMMT